MKFSGPRAVLAAALLAVALACAAAPALAANVTVRIEGENATLVPRTALTTPGDPVQMSDNSTCPGGNVAGAIERATGGNWDRSKLSQTIMGETHDFSRSDYWALWVNNQYATVGLCDYTLADGDDVLLLVDFSPPPTYASTVFPLVLTGVPASVQRGESFTVSATEYAYDGSTVTPRPAQGATVSGGGITVTTGADGRATLAMPATGAFTLRAVKSSERSTHEPVCVHDGDDGTCGTAAAQGVSGGGALALDTRLADPSVGGIRNGQRFPARRAPRLLRGTVDPGGAGVHAVRLRIRRVAAGRCSFYSVRVERFRPGRCDATWFLYTIGDRPSWEYLLPEALRPGRYVLEVVVMDGWGRVVSERVRFTVLGGRR